MRCGPVCVGRHVDASQINYQENTLKSILSSFFTSSVKRTVPEDRWGNYLMAKTGWTEIDVSFFLMDTPTPS